MTKHTLKFLGCSNHKIFMYISLFFDSMQKRIKITWVFSVFPFQETLHSFVNRLFDALFGLNKEGIRIIPPAVKYLFDFLDQQAESLNIDNPEVYHTWKNNRSVIPSFPADIYVVKVKNGNARIMCDILSKLTIKTLERRLWSIVVSLVLIWIDFANCSAFSLSMSNKKTPAEILLLTHSFSLLPISVTFAGFASFQISIIYC